MEDEPAAIDAGLIAAAQRVEHYEIAGYGTVRSYAELLGEDDHVSLLEQTPAPRRRRRPRNASRPSSPRASQRGSSRPLTGPVDRHAA